MFIPVKSDSTLIIINTLAFSFGFFVTNKLLPCESATFKWVQSWRQLRFYIQSLCVQSGICKTETHTVTLCSTSLWATGQTQSSIHHSKLWSMFKYASLIHISLLCEKMTVISSLKGHRQHVNVFILLSDNTHFLLLSSSAEIYGRFKWKCSQLGETCQATALGAVNTIINLGLHLFYLSKFYSIKWMIPSGLNVLKKYQISKCFASFFLSCVSWIIWATGLSSYYTSSTLVPSKL